MNTQQIEYFLEVVRQGSFTKAAQILYTSQPSLSRQITKLEEELGTSLFNRSRSGVVLDVSLDRGFAISDVWSRGMSDRSLGHLVLEQEMPICVAWNAHHVCDDLFVFAEALSTCLSCFF